MRAWAHGASRTGQTFGAGPPREAQANATQRRILCWIFGNHYTITRQVNGRLLEACDGSNDNSAVTCLIFGSVAQQWALVPAH